MLFHNEHGEAVAHLKALVITTEGYTSQTATTPTQNSRAHELGDHIKRVWPQEGLPLIFSTASSEQRVVDQVLGSLGAKAQQIREK